MAQNPSPRAAMEIELTKLSSPRIFLVRMLVFLVLCALVMVVLYKQIIVAFFANPGLNALIGAVLLIGIILSFRQVIRLYPEVAWVNNFRIADPGLAPERYPTLLAPMAAILGALPLMIGWGEGSELRHPLGITMVGGLIFSQALTLFTTPVIYLAFDALARRVLGVAGSPGGQV